MGLFSKLKKAFKKIGKAVKKVVKKVVGGVKKVVKKISSSKILKALAIAAAIIVTGGAALTAFGGTGALASSQFGSWMMATSQSVLGGTAFGSAAAMKPGVGKFLTQTGNFLAKTASKPFGAVGGALGSTARVGVNLFTPEKSAFAPGTAVGAPAPFSGAALSGQLDYSQVVYDPVNQGYLNNKTGLPLTQEQINQLPESFTSTINSATSTAELNDYQKNNPSSLTGNKWGDYVVGGVGNVIGGVASGYAQQELLGGDPRGEDAPLMVEGAEPLGALQVYASNNNFDLSDIYGQLTYGTADPGFIASSELYRQDTIGVPA
jgi:hypothetical protein